MRKTAAKPNPHWTVRVLLVYQETNPGGIPIITPELLGRTVGRFPTRKAAAAFQRKAVTRLRGST